MEDNPGLATRLERALFDDHFEVLLVSGDALPVSVLESQYAAFESAGLVVIYSCDALPPEAKRKLSAVAANGFFDLSSAELPMEESEAVKKVFSLLDPLRVLTDQKDQDNIR